MELTALLAELAKLDQAAVVKAIQANNQPLFQAIFDMGHGVATQKLQPKVDEVTGQVTKLTADLTAATKRIETLSADHPDVAKLQTEIANLEAKIRQAEDAGTERLHAERRDTFMADLRTQLTALGVDADYAGVVLAKPEVQKRLRINKAGEREVLRKGSDIVLMPGDKPLVRAVAEELVAEVPPKFISSPVDRGSGIEQGGAAADKSYLSTLRSDLEKKREAESKVAAGPGEAARRLGMSPAVPAS